MNGHSVLHRVSKNSTPISVKVRSDGLKQGQSNVELPPDLTHAPAGHLLAFGEVVALGLMGDHVLNQAFQLTIGCA